MADRINPGRMRERITLDRRVETISASGSVAVQWIEEATLRAELVQQDAQAFLDSVERTEDRRVFRLWAVPFLDASMRVTHEGRTYRITKIVPLDRLAVELHCVDGGEDAA